MKYRFCHIVVVLLMLLSQSAVAVHNVEHQGYEHSDQCRAFLGGEQSAAVASTPSVVPTTEYHEQYQPLITPFYADGVRSSYSPRAPPESS